MDYGQSIRSFLKAYHYDFNELDGRNNSIL